MSVSEQLLFLFLLPLPIACVAWTITHEEIFREPREWCSERSKRCRKLLQRKFFYMFTCEYCLSHYVTLFFLLLTGFKLLLPDWRGYVLSEFALVWLANIYISIYNRLRLELKREQVEIAVTEQQKEQQQSQAAG